MSWFFLKMVQKHPLIFSHIYCILLQCCWIIFVKFFQIVWPRAGLCRAIAWRGHKKQFCMESKIFCHLTFAWKTRGKSSGSRAKVFNECHWKSTWQWKFLELHLRVIFLLCLWVMKHIGRNPRFDREQHWADIRDIGQTLHWGH